jgi:CRISPR/Cas system-associated exonuclease Cas4 (RecB family)
MPNKKLYLSATAITDFLGCPYKFKLRSMWGIKEPVDNLGLRVHRAMQDGVAPSDMTAARLYKQLNFLLKENNISVQEKEKRYADSLNSGIVFTRVLDVVGNVSKVPVIVDYKTASWPWDIVEGIVPQARTIQAAAYLMPMGYVNWPTMLYFLVVNSRTSPQTFVYHRNVKDEKNLLKTMELIVWADTNNCFPSNPGKSCVWCDWAAACFKTDGWEKKYKKRTDRV